MTETYLRKLIKAMYEDVGEPDKTICHLGRLDRIAIELEKWACGDCGIKNSEHRAGYNHAQHDILCLLTMVSSELARINT